MEYQGGHASIDDLRDCVLASRQVYMPQEPSRLRDSWTLLIDEERIIHEEILVAS